MDMNEKGRSYRKCGYLSEDIRQLTVDELIILGANKFTGFIPRTKIVLQENGPISSRMGM